MQTVAALKRIEALATSLREHRAQVWRQAQSPVFRRALAAQTVAELDDLRLLYRVTRFRGWERTRRAMGAHRRFIDVGPGQITPPVRSISDSLHAADVAAGFDDLSVVVPDDEPTALDRVMDEWVEPELPADLGDWSERDADAWNQYQERRWHDLCRVAKLPPYSTQSFSCSVVFGRGWWMLDGAELRERRGLLSIRMRTHSLREVLTSVEQKAYFDDAAWAARRVDVPDRIRAAGPEADFVIGPEVDAPEPVQGPDVEDREWQPTPTADGVLLYPDEMPCACGPKDRCTHTVTKRLDTLYAQSYEDVKLAAQPAEDVLLSHDADWTPSETDAWTGFTFDRPAAQPYATGTTISGLQDQYTLTVQHAPLTVPAAIPEPTIVYGPEPKPTGWDMDQAARQLARLQADIA